MPASGTVRVICPGSGNSSLRSSSRWIGPVVARDLVQGDLLLDPDQVGHRRTTSCGRAPIRPRRGHRCASTSSRAPTMNLKPRRRGRSSSKTTVLGISLTCAAAGARGVRRRQAARRGSLRWRRSASTRVGSIGGHAAGCRSAGRGRDRRRCRGRLVGDVGQHDQRLGRIGCRSVRARPDRFRPVLVRSARSRGRGGTIGAGRSWPPVGSSG